MSDIGPHLLGRKPSPPDPRNFRLSLFLEATPTKLQALNDALQHSSTSKATKAWANEVTALLAPATPPMPTPTPPVPAASSKRWLDRHQLDQGSSPHCVGMGWAQFLNCEPVEDNEANADGHAIYYECKVIDGEPGAEDGSSVHSGAKAIRNRGRIDGYAFATTLKEITDWILTKGPVVVGTDWTNDMFSVDASGLVHPTGAVAGGHCYLAVGYDDTSRTITFQNSWGSKWGARGFFAMHVDDWWRLFQSNGEAAAAVELA